MMRVNASDVVFPGVVRIESVAGSHAINWDYAARQMPIAGLGKGDIFDRGDDG